ncbi:MAG: hypothetical protein J0I34_31910 [Pseudonocardia sp.]|uniref:three-helix bundle dimerization domain-containing protein n=1 Tax=unclassified Pseudonocardia TaxID=2619320 RepID=UPI000868C120|nr:MULTISPECIES: hypothetical protein [unclassified Pseudonocardia]MBN9113377.1 hypothetical protein [Pseudonocardia sp.]ODU23281.1 MAG: hypothetical protein ABS80_15420 [Pseudonocardia sp. SCN 72-51]ODV03744.1 MAG: hypothetical protein ABT15_22210 [Pseudonocardia sp. SCN 73-27]
MTEFAGSIAPPVREPRPHGVATMLLPLRPVGDTGAALAQVKARLIAEFGSGACAGTIDQVVDDCCRDLCGAPPGALPELVERLARQRLLEGAAWREHGRPCRGSTSDPVIEFPGAPRGGRAPVPA